MATALAKGWRDEQAGLATDFIASDPLEAARTAFAAATGGHVTERNLDVIGKSDLVVLAVKPQTIPTLLPEIAPALTAKHLIVSIVAGVTIRKLTEALGSSRIIRVMPNLPCLVGASASAYAVGGSATPADAALVQRLLDGVGRAIEVPERMLDAVTGLSGSGAGVRLHHDRGTCRTAASAWACRATWRPCSRGPDSARSGANRSVARNGPSSRFAEGPGDESWRHHDRGAACS